MKLQTLGTTHYALGSVLALFLTAGPGCGPPPAATTSSATVRPEPATASSSSSPSPGGTLVSATSGTSALPAVQGYRIGMDSATAEAGPVRMAKFSLVSGGVDWRANSGVGWSAAAMNLPLRQGADIWTTNGARSEVQFDDGSDMRLGAGAVAELTTMYSDAQGEFTEVKLNNGLATFHLVNKDSMYQIDTPSASIKAYGPALIRVGDTSGLEVADRAGQCRIEGKPGNLTLAADQYINFPANATGCRVERAPAQDQWDKFSDNRDTVVYQDHRYIPHNIGLMAGDMDSYGSWHNDPDYGEMWAPRESSNWAPYHDGRWVWSDPYGWTWVGNEPWGWAPYHYGTWSHRSWGWGWRPGPERQYWSPAVVQFTDYNNSVAWCALDPVEVRYPAEFSAGFAGGDWYLSFGIGGAACYYPYGQGYDEPHSWRNSWVNGGGNRYNITNINNYYGSDRGLAASWRGGSGWVPRNSRYGGATYVSEGGFARGTGGYQRLDPGRASFFSKGRGFRSPANGASPLSGPFNVRPNSSSFTASRHFSANGPSEAVMNRSVYRSQVPGLIAQRSTNPGRTLNAANRGGSARPSGPRPARGGAAQAINHSAAARPSGANRYNRFNAVSHSSYTGAMPAQRGRGSTARTATSHATNRSAARPSRPSSSARAPRQGRSRGTDNVRRSAAPARRSSPAPARRSQAAPARRSIPTQARPSRGGGGGTRPSRGGGGGTHQTRSGGGGSSRPSRGGGGGGHQSRGGGGGGGGHQTHGGGGGNHRH